MRMLPTSIAVQGFKSVARRNSQVVDLLCGIDRKELGPRTTLNLNRQIPDPKAGE